LRRHAAVDLDADHLGPALAQRVEESAVAGRWFEHPALVAAQVEHEGHDIGRREDLAELRDVEAHQLIDGRRVAAFSAAAFSRAFFSQ
jgi:hypothetical protein